MFKYAQIWRKAPHYFLAALCAALISAAPSAAQNTADEKQVPTIKPQILRVGFGLERPPFVFKNHKDGLEIELINAIAKEMKYTVIASFWPNARGYNALKNKSIDIYTIGTQSLADEFYLSDTYMSFDNVLISKGDNPQEISQFSDLRGKRLAAFQGADFLVKEITEIKDELSLYIETPRQITQIHLLYKERVDFLFSEKKVFEYNLKRAFASGELAPLGRAYKIHRVVPPTLYSAAFNDPILRDKFNAALRRLKKSGAYAQIMSKYDQGFEMP